MITIINGPIVGLGAREYIERAADEAKKLGQELVYFHLTQEIAARGFDFLAFMSMNDFQRNEIRENVYRELATKISKLDQNVHAVIRVVSTVEWRDVNEKFKDIKLLLELFSPDLIVTLMDSELRMMERLQTIPSEGNELARITKEYLRINALSDGGEEELLDWLNEEVSIAEDWSVMGNMRHVVLSVNEPPVSLARLCVAPDVPTIYVSYPMTFLQNNPDFAKQKNELVQTLSLRAVVIDPATVELGANAGQAANSYTVHRDLHWVVKKVSAVVGLQPNPPVFSFGMLDEFQHAKGYAVPAYLVFPKGSGGPFGADQFVEKSHMFLDIDKLNADAEFNKLFPKLS